MAMDAARDRAADQGGLPDAQVTIEDLRGDGDHYAAHVVSAAFSGKTRVQQHQMVYQALAGPDGRRAARAGAADQRVPNDSLNRAAALRRFTSSEDIEMDTTVQDRISQRSSRRNDVVLFMKGTPVFPQCGFSAAVVQILTHLGVKFKGVDVLADPSVRQGIKEFSNWPTIPQLYVKGEFIGGCDIVREMFQTGELQQMLQTKGVNVKVA